MSCWSAGTARACDDEGNRPHLYCRAHVAAVADCAFMTCNLCQGRSLQAQAAALLTKVMTSWPSVHTGQCLAAELWQVSRWPQSCQPNWLALPRRPQIMCCLVHTGAR